MERTERNSKFFTGTMRYRVDETVSIETKNHLVTSLAHVRHRSAHGHLVDSKTRFLYILAR